MSHHAFNRLSFSFERRGEVRIAFFLFFTLSLSLEREREKGYVGMLLYILYHVI